MRLLMIHGYAQNDEIFRAKSRRFTAYMHGAYPHTEFVWAKGPLHLHPGDGTDSSEDLNSQEDGSGIDFRAWFHQDVAGRSFREESASLSYLADLLRRHGPFDGVVGFSQGSIMAVTIASLLQGDTRRKAYETRPHSSETTLPYPYEFSHMAHPPLKFGILFCPGLLQRGAEWLWNDPGLSTPFCRFVGRYDTVVSAMQRDTALRMTATKGTITVTHHGGHSLPTSDIFSKHLPSFFASISGLEDGIFCRNVFIHDQKVVPRRNDSAFEERSRDSSPAQKQTINVAETLSHAKTVLYLVCIFRQKPHVPLDASALKMLSNSGQILSVDPIAGTLLPTIRDGW